MFPRPRLPGGFRVAMSPLLAKQLAWFIAVGCAAAATHWAVAVALVSQAGLAPPIANIAGWLIAFLVSFSGHYFLTFRHTGAPWVRAAPRFFLISARGFAVNEAAYIWLLRVTSLPYDALLAAILIAVAALTFLASRLWAFRHGGSPS
jgi:putative flippase GtrA